MGTKRRRKREYIYHAIACLSLCLGVACAPVRMIFTDDYACNHLKRVEALIAQRDFDSAIKESQENLERCPKASPGDAALMSLGLLHVHYANPKKDYARALGYFLRLEKDFPRSPLVEEAKIWIGVLQAFEKAKQVDLEIQKKMQGLGK